MLPLVNKTPTPGINLFLKVFWVMLSIKYKIKLLIKFIVSSLDIDIL